MSAAVLRASPQRTTAQRFSTMAPMYRSELCTVRSRWGPVLRVFAGFRDVGRRGAGHSFGDFVRPVAAPFKKNRNGACPTVSEASHQDGSIPCAQSPHAILGGTLIGSGRAFPRLESYPLVNIRTPSTINRAHLRPVRSRARHRCEGRRIPSYRTCPPKLCPAPRQPTSRNPRENPKNRTPPRPNCT
jgi:hypothetical protein